MKALGAATGSTRTGDQTQIALFWADGPGTITPPGHWNQIAQQMGAVLGNTLQENARLFALLNLAMADAAICAWDAKDAFNFWRPVTAIRMRWRRTEHRGRPDQLADRDASLSDYMSGHSTFSGAAATVLVRFYGTDNIAFVTGADATPGA